MWPQLDALRPLAAERRHLFTTAEAATLGIQHDVLRRAAAPHGPLTHVDHGVYAFANRDGGPFQAAHAGLLVVGPRAFLQVRTAAALHGGLDLRWDGSVELGVPLPSASRRASRRLVDERRIVRVAGLRVTDPLLTLLDLAAALKPAEWELALEASLRTGAVALHEVEGALLSAAGAPARGAPTARRVLAARPPGVRPTGSFLETRFVQVARAAGVPPPERQVEVRHPASGSLIAVVDLAWPDLGLFAELDGQQHKDQPVYDAVRETNVVAATGWLCGRFNHDLVVRTPRAAGRKLKDLVEQARRRPMAA